MDKKSFAAGVLFACPVWALLAHLLGVSTYKAIPFLILSFIGSGLYLIYQKAKNR